MNHLLSLARQSALLEELFRQAAARAEAETGVTAGLAHRTSRIDEQFEERRRELAAEYETQRRRLENDYAAAIEELTSSSERELANARRGCDEICAEAQHRFDQESAAAATAQQDAGWQSQALYDASQNSLDGELTPRLEQINECARLLGDLHQAAARFRQRLDFPGGTADAAPVALAPGEDPLPRLQQGVQNAGALAAWLGDFRRRPLLKAMWLLPVFVAAWAVLMLMGRTVYRIEIFRPEGLPWLALCSAATVAFAVFVLLLRAVFRKRYARRLCLSLHAVLQDADACREYCLSEAEEHRRRQLAHSKQQMKDELAEQERAFHQKTADVAVARDQAVEEAQLRLNRQVAEVSHQRDQGLAEVEEEYPPQLEELRRRFEAQTRQLDEEHHRQQNDSQAVEQQDWVRLSESWRQAMEQLRGDVLEINGACDEVFPSWHSPAWKSWTPRTEVPPAIRFGGYDVDLKDVPGGMPLDERLREMTLANFTLPALLPFPASSSLMYKASGNGRDHAVRSLQTVMLRLLTAIPPGKVRFTIIDPVGLGENFAGFMHLADHDEAMVHSRIWTERGHIESRLTDLTEHLENVIQKYLRSQYQTIEEYNKDAGEVAEPFRILVVANFPHNFTEAAVRRLIAIAGSGARCGVYTLLTVDTRQKLPSGCHLKDLEQHCTVLKWDGERFHWQHDLFGKFPLRLDAPPLPDLFRSIIHQVGEASRDANRVELPFERIVPADDELWTGDCGSELTAPLGQAGATKLHHLRLGKGTSQHVLVAGKTGSGKSTLLHVLISSLALKYSPDEVQLYLVDFKKGVEFKTYATHHLPHARVVAVESEREFGLSVLQRLDAELTDRGQRFRSLGVQDINAYRQAAGEPLPRILLLIDEFQELFVEDDRTSSEASLLLDRLVRQGRAFGMHVLLGSQTLGGAYSLARSTLGQMAVRIALECSETDANLILSEGNTAARLLSRPGEAIYNDANGRIEGNKPFQIAWLPDEKREDHLRRVAGLAESRGWNAPGPQIVFEGNMPAALSGNHALEELLEHPCWSSSTPASVFAYLGSPVAIKEPTAAMFRRQGGSNLLIVGQNETASLGILSASLVSLAAQHGPGSSSNSARFYVLDGTPADGMHAGHLKQLAAALPHDIEIVPWREVGRAMNEIATEVARRDAENQTDAPAIYLLIHNLGRFRDLRRDENDFGFGGFGASREDAPPANPAQQLVSILRDGAGLGVHAILWSDSANSLNRALDRQMLREFDQRVVFQMSGDDSSNLIDSPAAARLGHYRALLHNEEEGTLEKFRPYDPPGEEWLRETGERLAAVTK